MHRIEFLDSHIYKTNISEMFQVFSWFVLGVLVSPMINNVGFGAWWRAQKPRNHENEGFGSLKNEIGILLYQTEAGPKIAIIILVFFPTIFLWFSNDFHMGPTFPARGHICGSSPILVLDSNLADQLLSFLREPPRPLCSKRWNRNLCSLAGSYHSSTGKHREIMGKYRKHMVFLVVLTFCVY